MHLYTSHSSLFVRQDASKVLILYVFSHNYRIRGFPFSLAVNFADPR